MKSSEFDAWKEKLREKIDRVGLSENETAGFFLILKGFSQSGQDLQVNANVIVTALQDGSFKIWNQTFKIHPDQFFAINFTSDKWLTIVGSAMNALHARVNENPKSLLFLTAQEKNVTAASMFATVQNLAQQLWKAQE
jgi:hypothetical protein